MLHSSKACSAKAGMIASNKISSSLKPNLMGTITKGILGGFNGTVGTVIGGSWKGIDYMRSRPAKRTNNPTPAQLEQQAKFAEVIKFLDPMVGLIRMTYRNFAIKMTAFNSAMSYHLRFAITGTYPNFSIDYSLAQVSRGDLPNTNGPTVTKSDNNINFTWTDNSGTGRALATDRAILVAYCPSLNQTIYTTNGGARIAGSGSLNAANFAGETVHTYIGFISEDGKEVATSIYTGELSL